VAKNKLRRFAENETFENLFQPTMSEVMNGDFHLKGKWRSNYFKNNNPIVLELGCGKGEYSVGLAKMFPDKNFIGADIKGARLWRGAKTAVEEKMSNVAFIRTRIEHIASFFAPEEVDEIWVTFPDPQPRENGIVHLKTDSQALHVYTKAVIEHNNLKVNICTNDLYATVKGDPILGIRTHYEQLFMEKGFTITYINFQLNHAGPFNEPELQDE